MQRLESANGDVESSHIVGRVRFGGRQYQLTKDAGHKVRKTSDKDRLPQKIAYRVVRMSVRLTRSAALFVRILHPRKQGECSCRQIHNISAGIREKQSIVDANIWSSSTVLVLFSEKFHISDDFFRFFDTSIVMLSGVATDCCVT
jgi:hypothetical protein